MKIIFKRKKFAAALLMALSLLALALGVLLFGAPAAAQAAGDSNSAFIVPAENSVTYGSSLTFFIGADGLSLTELGDVSWFLDDKETAFFKVNVNTFPYNQSITIQGAGWTAGQHTVKVVITSRGQTYEGTCVLTVTKANQNLPAPTTVSKTSAAVTLNAVTGQGEVQYACVQGENASAPAEDSNAWQDATEFTGLQPATAYTFFARCAGNDYYNAATSGAVIYTNYAAPTGLNLLFNRSGIATASWNKVEGATSYTVTLYQQGTENPVDTKTVAAANYNRQAYDLNITSSGTYYFTVKATDVGMDGDAEKSERLTFYEVRFESNGGTEVPSQYVTEYNRPDKPDDPARDGYTFGGWYKDQNLNTEWSFAAVGSDTVSQSDVTLYAKWTAIVYNVTVTVGTEGGGTASAPLDSAVQGTEITAVLRSPTTNLPCPPRMWRSKQFLKNIRPRSSKNRHVRNGAKQELSVPSAVLP